jgi:hypothetical protein
MYMAETITAQQFVQHWSKVRQKETAVYVSHFEDLCRLVGHQTPTRYDPVGQNFSFQSQAVKPDGAKGFADVFYRDKFIMEYKGPHADLDRAYRQLQLYREALDNPPLLITSDVHTIHIHTNFNNYPKQRHVITFDDILSGDGVEKLRWAFFNPQKFRPARTQQDITRASADTFIAVADAMKLHQKITGEQYSAEQLAHFLIRILFCLFAEDLKLLPNNIFTQIARAQFDQHADLRHGLRNLFREMRSGGTFGFTRIRHFDGTLFDDEFVPTIPHDLARALLQAAEQDWSGIDPSIFGTLFQRVIDESQRAQLGAHYTSEDDIMLIVEPVLMAPLRRRWDAVRREADRLLRQAEREAAQRLLADFAAELAELRLLDPACGSGNFLYVGLRQLLNLQKAVIAFAARWELPPIPLSVGPQQLYGIEINTYAHELAQITVWIGYLQWRSENGFGEMPDPILRPLHNIRHMDAILAYDADGAPVEPDWPAADVIVGNPPFLGAKWMQRELGQNYTARVRRLYGDRVAGTADLVMYWFERAREYIEQNKVERVGLLATNTVRQGGSAETLKRIKETGDIFLAYTDKPWILEGASLRVSIIGFDDGSEKTKSLNDAPCRAHLYLYFRSSTFLKS